MMTLPVSSAPSLLLPRRSEGSTSHDNLLFEADGNIADDSGEGDIKLGSQRALEDENRKLLSRLEVVEEVRREGDFPAVHSPSCPFTGFHPNVL